METVGCFSLRATLSKSIKNIFVRKKKKYASLHLYARNTGIGAFDLTSVFCEISRTKNRLSLSHGGAFTLVFRRFILRCGRWYLSHASTRNVSRAIYKTRVRRIDRNLYVAVRRARLRARAVNSYRKLIQDNYRDETLKHINCQRMPR